MTNEDYKISRYGEMIDADRNYIFKMVQDQDIKRLIIDIQQIIETTGQANVESNYPSIEAKIRNQVNNFSDAYYKICKHLSGSSFKGKFYTLLNNIKPID